MTRGSEFKVPTSFSLPLLMPCTMIKISIATRYYFIEFDRNLGMRNTWKSWRVENSLPRINLHLEVWVWKVVLVARTVVCGITELRIRGCSVSVVETQGRDFGT